MQCTLRFYYVAATAVVFAAVIIFAPRTSFAAQITITMTDSVFSPSSVIINPGDIIRWINSGSLSHTVTSDSGNFDSGALAPGQSFTAMFNAAGTYAYHCNLHGGAGGVGMSGRFVVGVPASGVSPDTSNTYAASVAQLQVQVQALLNQVAAIKAQTGAVAPGAASGAGVVFDSRSCPLVGRSLKRGSTGEDVTRLQQFLARDPSVYPAATVSGYYGALTEAAVQRWQVKYNIVSSGTPDTTGYGVVGPRTASAIALLCTTGSYGGVPSQSVQAPVGGLIVVTPISGNAPLVVSVAASVNTAKSCVGATYVLDFGDSSAPQQIPVPSGNCGQIDKTYPHTYQYGGTYTIKLSASGGRSIRRRENVYRQCAATTFRKISQAQGITRAHELRRSNRIHGEKWRSWQTRHHRHPASPHVRSPTRFFRRLSRTLTLQATRENSLRS